MPLPNTDDGCLYKRAGVLRPPQHSPRTRRPYIPCVRWTSRAFGDFLMALCFQPVSVATAEHYGWGVNCDGWHLLKRDDLSIILERMPSGSSEIRHYHRQSRQFFYILEGEATLITGDEAVSLRVGQGLEVPPWVAHQIRNGTTSDLVFLVVSAPKSHGDRVNLSVEASSSLQLGVLHANRRRHPVGKGDRGNPVKLGSRVGPQQSDEI